MTVNQFAKHFILAALLLFVIVVVFASIFSNHIPLVTPIGDRYEIKGKKYNSWKYCNEYELLTNRGYVIFTTVTDNGKYHIQHVRTPRGDCFTCTIQAKMLLKKQPIK